MRKLHPVGPHEIQAAAGAFRRPDGSVETWTSHALPGGRRIVRVEVGIVGDRAGLIPAAPEASAHELWHLMLDAEHRPERLEVRLREGGGMLNASMLDATFTFFEDEVLIWRRGGEPASEAIAIPPGYRLLWPPMAGRDACLAGVVEGDSPAAVMCFSIRRRPAERGWLRCRPIKFTVRGGPGWLSLTTPGLAELRAELDESGTAMAWSEGGDVTERVGD